MSIERGKITNITSEKDIRVKFPKKDETLSYKLELSADMNLYDLNINDDVIVAFYNNIEGVIIAKCRY